ncbi:outer membrane protein assembly factor BamB family protein [Calycomorphotria hydatis]|uniref:Outer membrane biogenesis protein BamB n=1 Tax=Calycomorphotria hydatis TaxID=2528027 RepID=A0A517TCR4_9PLAN|nr:PQQ-binding-like beta-propeller repeat protein [Calycomorphotria hydatis]QDT66158.1 outer membrane biogenesis protein BamB [Calycomorphotria hydatis]
MSVDESPAAEEVTEKSEVAANEPADTADSKSLRRWPILILLLMIPVCWYLQKAWETPPLWAMMLSFFGPMWLGAIFLLYWTFFSRAVWKEKFIGLAGLVIAIAVPLLFVDQTLQGMGVIYLGVPSILIAAGLSLLVFGGSQKLRVPLMLMFVAATAGAWNLFRWDGATSDFKAELSWRWEPSAEDEYLASIDRDAPLGIPGMPVFDASNPEWPGFRGKHRDSKVGGVTLLTDWDSNPPEQLWKQKIGPAWSSFSLAYPYLFTQEQRGEQEAVVCMHADSGETIWATEYESRFWEPVAGAGPRATPTLTEDSLFVLGAAGILHRLNPASGKVIWKVDITEDANRDDAMPVPIWGFSASPLIYKDLVIVYAGGTEDRGVLAYGKKNGDFRWGAPSGNHSYSSAEVATLGGTEGILMASNEGVSFIDPADGSTLWTHEEPYEGYRVLQPLVYQDAVLLATPMGDGTHRLAVAHSDEDWSVTEDWSSRGMKSDFNDFVEHEGYLYGFDVAIFGCIDLETGKRQWKGGRYGKGQVLLLTESGQLLVLSEKGELVLLNATPTAHEEIAKVQVLEGKTWNHPILVGDRIYLRNAEEAACYRLPVQSSEPESEDEPTEEAEEITGEPSEKTPGERPA